MACPHGHGAPDGCSSCLGIPARRVEIVGRTVVIDGAPIASVEEVQAREHEDHHAMPAHRRGASHSVGSVRHCTRCGGEGHTARRCAAP